MIDQLLDHLPIGAVCRARHWRHSGRCTGMEPRDPAADIAPGIGCPPPPFATYSGGTIAIPIGAVFLSPPLEFVFSFLFAAVFDTYSLNTILPRFLLK